MGAGHVCSRKRVEFPGVMSAVARYSASVGTWAARPEVYCHAMPMSWPLGWPIRLAGDKAFTSENRCSFIAERPFNKG